MYISVVYKIYFLVPVVSGIFLVNIIQNS